MAVQAVLAGMPVAADLSRSDVDGRVVIRVGATVLFDYAASDLAPTASGAGGRCSGEAKHAAFAHCLVEDEP